MATAILWKHLKSSVWVVKIVWYMKDLNTRPLALAAAILVNQWL